MEEYPGKYVGGSLAFEGVVEEHNGVIEVVYHDMGEEEGTPLSHFPVKGRTLYSEQERYNYWKTAFLSAEPPEECYKRELYAFL